MNPLLRHSILLRPFRVPNFVLAESKSGRKEDGLKETPKYPLRDLSESILNQLCDQFRKDILRRASEQRIQNTDNPKSRTLG